MAVARSRIHHAKTSANFRRSLQKGQALVADGRYRDALLMLEHAHGLCPNDPDVLFQLALVADRLDAPRRAADLYGAVLLTRPDAVEAANNLGNVLTGLGEYDAAVDTFRAAIEYEPESPRLWLNLGKAVAADGDPENALVFYDQALRIDPHYGEAFANMAELCCAEGRARESLPLFERALKLMPDDAQVHFNLAITLLALGDLERGWREYEYRLDKSLARAIDYRHDVRRWDGGPLDGKTILICAEQGLGDQVLFASCVPEMIGRAGHCIIECEARLVPLFERSFPAATVHATEGKKMEGRVAFNYNWLNGVPEPDLYIEIGSLPLYLRRRIADFPDQHSYLVPNGAAVDAWRARLDALGPGLKVGICWRSMLMTAARRQDYSLLDDWGEVLSRPGVRFVNLQYDDCGAELGRARARFGIDIHDFAELDQMNDFASVADLLAALDLVITAPTMVSGLAGAVGAPTLRLLHMREWPSLGTRREPFQPSVAPLWPGEPGNWAHVLAMAGERVGELVAGS